MKKIIIGIHGLGNKPDRQTLENWWRASIEEGLKRQKFNSSGFEFEMVYWADLLYQQALDPTVQEKENPLYIEDPYIPTPVSENHEKNGSIRQKIMDMVGDQLENIFLNKDLTINFSSVNDFIIRHFFKDLAVYYNTYHDQHSTANEQKKKAICEVLSETLLRHRKKQILLIAHSMGAIIAYDVLMQLPEVNVNTFITIGCPLGLPTIRSKIAAEHSEVDDPQSILRTPATVRKNWYNFADLRDKIALYYRLADDFKPNASGIGVVDRTVTNDYNYHGEKNPHKSYGYLQTAEVAQVVNAFLTEQRPGLVARVSAFFARLFSTRI